MYQRLQNCLDLRMSEPDLFAQIQDRKVYSRIEEVLRMYDGSYGESRLNWDMGGYALIFTEEKVYHTYLKELMDLYHFDADCREYIDLISTSDKGNWYEELYLIGAEDSIVIFHPEEEQK